MLDLTAVCTVCGHRGPLAPGPGGRLSASCEVCGSMERHRFLVLLLASTVANRAKDSFILDVAPSKQISPVLRKISPDRYLSIDVDPEADGRSVDLTASLTELPFDDGSVGLLVCYHVLEHIPDDRLAMSEVARTLAPRGLAILQVPWKRDQPTDEDPSASVEERVRRFGQADHVRYYGADFVPRLEQAGLSVLEIRPQLLADENVLRMMGIRPDESVWLAATSPGALPDLADLRAGMDVWIAQVVAAATAPAPDPVDPVDPAALAALSVEVAAARQAARRWQKESGRWQKRYESLRSRKLVRAMAALSRPFR
jgi:SAM-dependent methyltransferase